MELHMNEYEVYMSFPAPQKLNKLGKTFAVTFLMSQRNWGDLPISMDNDHGAAGDKSPYSHLTLPIWPLWTFLFPKLKSTLKDH